MLGRGFQSLAVNGEVDDDFVRVVDGVRNGVETDRIYLFIPCQSASSTGMSLIVNSSVLMILFISIFVLPENWTCIHPW